MKHSLRALAFLTALLPSWALAQSAPATMPYHTVYGRLGAAPGDTGPGQAIPFATISGQLLNSLCTTDRAFPVYSLSLAKWVCSTAPAANTVFAGPTSGGAQQPTFRQLVVSDMVFGAGIATWLGTPTSANLAAALTNETGTGVAVFSDSPVFTTQIQTPFVTGGPATNATITLRASAAGGAAGDVTNIQGHTINLAGLAGATTTVNVGAAASSNGILAIAGSSTGATSVQAGSAASGTLTLPSATDTLVGKATTDILTNKTIDTAGTGNHIQISGVDITRGQILGEASTGSATAGNVGEYISSQVTSGSPVSLTTTTVANLTSISLTAGDWDVSCTTNYQGGATTTVSFLESSISLITATQDRTENRIGSIFYNNAAIFGTIVVAPVAMGPVRFSFSGTTTVFCVARGNFATSTLTVYGTLRARRAR